MDVRVIAISTIIKSSVNFVRNNYLPNLFLQCANIISISRYKLSNMISKEDVGGRSKSHQSCVSSKHVLNEHRQVIIHISRDL